MKLHQNILSSELFIWSLNKLPVVCIITEPRVKEGKRTLHIHIFLRWESEKYIIYHSIWIIISLLVHPLICQLRDIVTMMSSFDVITGAVMAIFIGLNHQFQNFNHAYWNANRFSFFFMLLYSSALLMKCCVLLVEWLWRFEFK